MKRLRIFLGAAWNYLREVSGENDYARYCARVLAHGGRPASAQNFFLRQLEHKYSRPNRCC